MRKTEFLTTIIASFVLNGCVSTSICKTSRHSCMDYPHDSCRSKCNEITQHTRYLALTDPKEIEATIPKCKDEKLYCVVADLYERIGDFESAILMYGKAGKYESAARLQEKMSDSKGAQASYISAFYQKEKEDCMKCALKVAKKISKPEFAEHAKNRFLAHAESYSNFNLASELAEELADFERAGINAEKAELYFKAAQLFEKAGDKKRALENYAASDDDRKVNELCLELIAKEKKNHNEIGTIPYYVMLKDYHLAGKAAHDNRLFADAKKYYCRAGIYELVQDKFESDVKKEASILFEQGEFIEAAELCELIGDLKKSKIYRGVAASLVK